MLITNRMLSLVLMFSVLAVWSHWNFFIDGIFALGVNTSLVWLGIAIILYAVDSSYRFSRDWVWLCPITFIVLSYSLFENPWLKLISTCLLPIMVGVFCAYSHFGCGRELVWNSQLLKTMGIRMLKPAGMIATVVRSMFDRSFVPRCATADGNLRRVFRGFVYLLPLSLVAIVLLSSADATFGELVRASVRMFLETIGWVSFFKLGLSILLTVVLLSVAVGWSGDIEYRDPSDIKTIDGLVAGIVLGGLLIIYFAFLSLQLDNLVIKALPENYRAAELMVKSGFWQLFLLAVLNTGLFFTVYRKTGWIAQWHAGC